MCFRKITVSSNENGLFVEVPVAQNAITIVLSTLEMGTAGGVGSRIIR